MRQLKTKLIIVPLLLLSSKQVLSYDMDVHYYVTAMILADLEKNGKPLAKNKLLAALSNQYVDDNDNTLPTNNPFNPQQRRNWHFPAAMEEGFFKNDYDTVKRNSVFAKHNVNRGLQDNNPTLLGMALHTYFDSFAHEGFSAYFGHASAGHDPDRPHLDTQKLREVVRMTYNILSQWYINNGVKVDDSKISLDKYLEWAKYVPPSYGCTFCGYSTGEIQERSNYWHTQITTLFPYLKLPTYAFLDGQDKGVFEGVASQYLTPYTESAAIGIEWYSKSFNNILGSVAYASTNNPGVIPSPLQSTIDAPFIGLKRDAAALLALDNPDYIRNGLPTILANKLGVLALFSAADKSQKGWETLYLAAASSHNNGVDWAAYTNIITPLLSSPKPEKKLFAIGALSVSGDTKKSVCNSINRFYGKVSLESYSDEQRSFLLNTVRNDPGYIAGCATQSMAVLERLLSDDNLGGQTAARLYSISANQNAYLRVIQDNPALAQNILSTRVNAKTLLHSQAEKLAKGGLAPKSFVNSKAFLGSTSDIQYWTVRSDENFDDDTPDSPSDIDSLKLLNKDLNDAAAKSDNELISGAASAIATYSQADQPSAALIGDLKKVLADSRFDSVKGELQYALDELQKQ